MASSGKNVRFSLTAQGDLRSEEVPGHDSPKRPPSSRPGPSSSSSNPVVSYSKHSVAPAETGTGRRLQGNRSGGRFSLGLALDVSETMKSLAVFKQRHEIVDTVRQNPVTVITGVTGCGKSAVIPLLLRNDSMPKSNSEAEKKKRINIIVAMPRRIAPISLCRFVCSEMGVSEGSAVGYQVGLEEPVRSNETQILYCTTGVLLQKLCFQNENPKKRGLAQFTHIILDEVHERSEDIDYALLLIKLALNSGEPAAKVIVMSGTMDSKPILSYFKDAKTLLLAPHVHVTGDPPYMVHEKYLEDIAHNWELDFKVDHPYAKDRLMDLVLRHLDDVYEEYPNQRQNTALVFLPGLEDIERMHDKLTMEYQHRFRGRVQWEVVPLHSLIPQHVQAAIFQPLKPQCRRIVLATNIAESSITVPFVDAVYDFCLTRRMVTDEDTKMSFLQTQWATKSNCDQRKGRAGRVGNGTVFRLIPKDFYEEFREHPDPEMMNVPVTSSILRSKMLGLQLPPMDLFELAISPPLPANVKRAVLILKEAKHETPVALVELVKSCKHQQNTWRNSLVYRNGSFGRGSSYIRYCLRVEESDSDLVFPLKRSQIQHNALSMYRDTKLSSDDGELTFFGSLCGRMPLSLNLAKLLYLSFAVGLGDDGIDLTCIITVRNVFTLAWQGLSEAFLAKKIADHGMRSDALASLNLFREWRERVVSGEFVGSEKAVTLERTWCTERGLSRSRLQESGEVPYWKSILCAVRHVGIDNEVLANSEEIRRRMAGMDLVAPAPGTLGVPAVFTKKWELLIKVIIAGAFYPDYIVCYPPVAEGDDTLESLDEAAVAEHVRTGGADPMRSIEIGLPTKNVAGSLFYENQLRRYVKAVTKVESCPRITYRVNRAVATFDRTSQDVSDQPLLNVEMVLRQPKISHQRTRPTTSTVTAVRDSCIDQFMERSEELSAQCTKPTAWSFIDGTSFKPTFPVCSVFEDPKDGRQYSLVPVQAADSFAFYARLYCGDMDPLGQIDWDISRLIQRSDIVRITLPSDVKNLCGQCLLVQIVSLKGKWARAKVVVTDKDMLELYFVDYGITERTKWQSCRLVLRSGVSEFFWMTPCLAVRCRLPDAVVFVPSAMDVVEFLHQTKRPLVCTVGRQHYDSVVLSSLEALDANGIGETLLPELASKHLVVIDNLVAPLVQPVVSAVAVSPDLVKPVLVEGTQLQLGIPVSPFDISFGTYRWTYRVPRYVTIHPDSVNSVLIRARHPDPVNYFLVSGEATVSKRRNAVISADTTLMPHFPGMLALISAVFAPWFETRFDAETNRPVGFYCGLGAMPETATEASLPVFAEHDFMAFTDAVIDDVDLFMIGTIRKSIGDVLTAMSSSAQGQQMSIVGYQNALQHQLLMFFGSIRRSNLVPLKKQSSTACARRWLNPLNPTEEVPEPVAVVPSAETVVQGPAAAVKEERVLSAVAEKLEALVAASRGEEPEPVGHLELSDLVEEKAGLLPDEIGTEEFLLEAKIEATADQLLQGMPDDVLAHISPEQTEDVSLAVVEKPVEYSASTAVVESLVVAEEVPTSFNLIVNRRAAYLCGAKAEEAASADQTLLTEETSPSIAVDAAAAPSVKENADDFLGDEQRLTLEPYGVTDVSGTSSDLSEGLVQESASVHEQRTSLTTSSGTEILADTPVEVCKREIVAYESTKTSMIVMDVVEKTESVDVAIVQFTEFVVEPLVGEANRAQLRMNPGEFPMKYAVSADAEGMTDNRTVSSEAEETSESETDSSEAETVISAGVKGGSPTDTELEGDISADTGFSVHELVVGSNSTDVVEVFSEEPSETVKEEAGQTFDENVDEKAALETVVPQSQAALESVGKSVLVDLSTVAEEKDGSSSDNVSENVVREPDSSVGGASGSSDAGSGSVGLESTEKRLATKFTEDNMGQSVTSCGSEEVLGEVSSSVVNFEQGKPDGHAFRGLNAAVRESSDAEPVSNAVVENVAFGQSDEPIVGHEETLDDVVENGNSSSGVESEFVAEPVPVTLENVCLFLRG